MLLWDAKKHGYPIGFLKLAIAAYRPFGIISADHMISLTIPQLAALQRAQVLRPPRCGY